MATEQEMSVHDKMHPTLGPTEEEQDVESLPKLVVPPGAYVDPNNLDALNNSVNLSVNDHPGELAEDYGASATVEVGGHVVHSTMSLNVDSTSSDNPEDRAEWTKKNWVDQAKEYGIPHSGNMDEVRERVEDYEAAQEERDAFVKEVDGMSRDELDKLASDYSLDPSEYSTKEDLAAAIVAAYDES